MLMVRTVRVLQDDDDEDDDADYQDAVQSRVSFG